MAGRLLPLWQMLALDYGLGRVFLIGTHPEIEEDSERDGVAFWRIRVEAASEEARGAEEAS